jgi:hypothetical protein
VNVHRLEIPNFSRRHDPNSDASRSQFAAARHGDDLRRCSGRAKVLAEEADDVVVGGDLVVAVGEAVAFVGVDVIADLDAASAKPVDDLVRLALGNAGISGALDDDQRCGDVVGVGDGGALEQLVGVGVVSRVRISGAGVSWDS